FQRGYDDEGEEEYFPTKKGFRFLEREFRRVVKEYALMPGSYVHPTIVSKCFSLLKDGHFESAVLQAFKTIETSIRDKINAQPEDVGTKLIRKAFHPDNGPLTDLELPKAEREAFCNYIAGAFGYYKNPCSHRDVEMDFITAFDRIVVASDLLKAIDKSIKSK
ncbi:TIGR02391 family protein, partial [bacterium]|nr:TIGR02391 family protein [bacterium]